MPQRCSEELARRGHTIGVYAGYRGNDRSPMEAWDEPGTVPVRWVNTTPWLSDLDARQFDNPEVTSDFERYLDSFKPDLAHFHALQGLGVGVVHVAAVRGIRTVLTMHDFWWWCARMFMCDRDYLPCCPVVECGTCECSAGTEWLRARNRTVKAALDRVDRIVAVSGSQRQVALANGCDEGRVSVVENGVAAAPQRSVDRLSSDGGVVRFAYAGGPDRMKGPHVLAAALDLLSGTDGWTLDAYGWPEDLPAGDRVRKHPPFEPSALDSVLGDADVLVVPSVMRESYSLLTREALGAGVPVITTDSLGPEEVIEEGRNGLIVPSADPAALGLAMRRVVEAPGLLDQLEAGCSFVALPTIGEQVDAYEGLYAELSAASPDPTPSRSARRPVRRVLFVVGINGAPLRYRAHLPAEALRELDIHCDIRHYRHPDVDRLGALADAVVMYRVPATVQVVNYIAGLRMRRIPVFFDVDDLIFDPALRSEIPAMEILPPDEAEVWIEGVRRYRATLECCDAFIGSTNALVEHARDVIGLPSFRFANGVGKLLAQRSDSEHRRARSAGRIRIGYLSGTDTHGQDWLYVEEAVARVLDENPDVELWLVGLIEPSAAISRHASRIVRRPFLPWHELPSVLRDLHINLAPLAPGSRFNDAKSAVKWLEAALVATPTVASPTEPFLEVIDHGRDGYVAADSEEWYRSISSLVSDPVRRENFGERSRRKALLRFAPALQGRRYLEILEAVSSTPDPPATGREWEAVSDDEPHAPFEVDAYRLPDEPAAEGLPPATWRSRLAHGRETLRAEGGAAAARGVVRFARRAANGRLRSVDR